MLVSQGGGVGNDWCVDLASHRQVGVWVRGLMETGLSLRGCMVGTVIYPEGCTVFERTPESMSFQPKIHQQCPAA